MNKGGIAMGVLVLALIAILFATNMKPIAQKKESCCGVY